MRAFSLFLISLAAFAQQPAAPPLPAIPDDVLLERDLQYSNVGQAVAMDVLRPKASASSPRPAVVLIHGGGFRAGRRESYIPAAIKLAQRGYVAATITYRLAPRHQYPAALEDAKAAVRFLRANAKRFNLDPEHIGAMGGSAGGHLVLMLGLTESVSDLEGTGPNRDQSSAVQAVANYYGPSDFTQSYQKSVDAADVLPLFLGGDLNRNRRYHQQSSPLNWVTPRAAPILSLHGTEDPYVAYEQSLWITERLVAAGGSIIGGIGRNWWHDQRGGGARSRLAPRQAVSQEVASASGDRAQFTRPTEGEDLGDRQQTVLQTFGAGHDLLVALISGLHVALIAGVELELFAGGQAFA